MRVYEAQKDFRLLEPSVAVLELLSGTAGARIVAAAMTESRLQASVLVCVQLIQRTALIIRRIESL